MKYQNCNAEVSHDFEHHTREEGYSCEDSRPASCSALPDHHRRYALAWALYRDETLTNEARETLEREMDSAQNLFGWDEFQAFKQTLSGFVECWAGWKQEVLNILEQNNANCPPAAKRSGATNC